MQSSSLTSLLSESHALSPASLATKQRHEDTLHLELMREMDGLEVKAAINVRHRPVAKAAFGGGGEGEATSLLGIRMRTRPVSVARHASKPKSIDNQTEIKESATGPQQIDHHTHIKQFHSQLNYYTLRSAGEYDTAQIPDNPESPPSKNLEAAAAAIDNLFTAMSSNE